jgi:hypothetical protein
MNGYDENPLVVGLLRIKRVEDLTRLKWPLSLCDQLMLVSEMDAKKDQDELLATVRDGFLKGRVTVAVNAAQHDREKTVPAFWFEACLAMMTARHKIEPTYVWQAPLGYRYVPEDMAAHRKWIRERATIGAWFDGFSMPVMAGEFWKFRPLWRWRSDRKYDLLASYPRIPVLEDHAATFIPYYDQPIVTPSVYVECIDCHSKEVFYGEEKEAEALGALCVDCFATRNRAANVDYNL